jgi:hypothetical protein
VLLTSPDYRRKRKFVKGVDFRFGYGERLHFDVQVFTHPAKPLTHPLPCHRIRPNMHSTLYSNLNSTKHGLGTMTMTTTSGKLREAFVVGQK